MYKDVRKKIVSVVVCICMIIGALQIVPKAEAEAATTQPVVDHTKITVQGRDPGGYVGNYVIYIETDQLYYDGTARVPTISKICKEGTDKDITDSDPGTFTLVRSKKNGTIDTSADVGEYTCYLKADATTGSNYSFGENDTTFKYNIIKTKIATVQVTLKDRTKIVEWKAGGGLPELGSITVKTDQGDSVDIPVSSVDERYTFTPDANNQNGYNVSASLVIKDGTNFDLASNPSNNTATVYFDEAYSLSGTYPDTTLYELQVKPETKNYESNQTYTPVLQFYDGNAYTELKSTDPVTVTYYESDGTTKVTDDKGDNKIKNAGTYVVKATPKAGMGGMSSVNGNYFTGTFTGSYTINARDASSLTVKAKSPKTGQYVTIYSGSGTETPETLVYKRTKDQAKELIQIEDVQVWDSNVDEPVTKYFKASWVGHDGSGNASLTLEPDTSVKNNNYTSSITIHYFIASYITVSSVYVDGKENNQSAIYTGNPVIPSSFKVTNADGEDVTDYKVTYAYSEDGGKSWIPADKADSEMGDSGWKRMIITGTGNYAGFSDTWEYQVSPVSMSEGSENASKFDLKLTDLLEDQSEYYQYYKGEEWRPGTVLTYNGHELTEGVDYTVTYGDASNSIDNITGSGKVTVTARSGSNYDGSRSVSFSIRKVDLNKAKLIGNTGTGPDIQYAYTGYGITPVIQLTDGTNYEYTLKSTDYEAEYTDLTDGKNESLGTVAPSKVGTYSITITNANTKGISGNKITLQYSIVKKDITADTSFLLTGVNIVDGKNTIEWNGGDTKPAVSCGTMVEGDDFDLAYNNCSAPGEATVVITGKGNYTGEKTISYTITERSLNNVNITAEAEVSGTGTDGILPDYTAKLTLVDEGKDVRDPHEVDSSYEVTEIKYVTDKTDTASYLSCYSSTDKKFTFTKAGEYQVTLKGKSNYKDERKVTITCGVDISKATFSISKEALTYSGQSQIPANVGIKATLPSGKAKTVYYTKDDLTNSPIKLSFSRAEDDEVDDAHADISAGTVYVTAEGNPAQGYFGTTETLGSYTIKPLNLSNTDYDFAIVITDKKVTTNGNTYEFPYTGETWEPVFIVQDAGNNITLSEGIDYTVSYPTAIEQGDYTITVTGTGNYGGTLTQQFTIGRTPINGDNIKISWSGANSASYADGVPVPKLKMGSYELVKGTDQDYTYTYKMITSGAAFYYEFTINGRNNFSGQRKDYYNIESTVMDGTDSSTPAVGQVYVASWDMSELMVDPANKEQKKPTKFSVCYMKEDGTSQPLTLHEDYEIVGYGQNTQPGTSGNSVTIEGIDGKYTGQATFTLTLYTNIKLATIANGSTITADGKISLKTLKDALNDTSTDPSALTKLLTLTPLWDDETGGRIDPVNYEVTIPDGYTPHIGEVTFTYAGTQQAPKYYAGSQQITMTVTGALDDELVSVTVGDGDVVSWNKTEITKDNLKVRVFDDGQELTKDVDYEVVSVTNGSGVGLASVTIQGKGNYSGTITHDFKITYPMASLTVMVRTATGSMIEYDGGTPEYSYNMDPTQNHPYIQLYYPGVNDVPVPVDTSLYKLTYNNCDRAGNAYAQISAPDETKYQGILTGGNRTVSYTLTRIPMSEVNVSMPTSTTYDGLEWNYTRLGLSLTYGTYSLGDSDCGISYNYNINTDKVDGRQAEVVITGMGNFEGTVIKYFSINPMLIGSATDISETAETLYYTGQPQAAKITLTQNTGRMRTLKEGSDQDYEIVAYLDVTKSKQLSTYPTEVGTYYVRVAGRGNYESDINNYRDIKFEIKKRDVNDGVNVIFLDSSEPEYDGTAQEPRIRVTYNGETLYDPTDSSIKNPKCEVTYANNIDAGVDTATITITATSSGSFDGTMVQYFTITPRDLSDLDYRDLNGNTFEDEASYEWQNGKAVQPGVNVYDRAIKGSTALTQGDEGTDGADYYIEYKDDNDDYNSQTYAGKVEMTIKGQNNYTGEKTFTYYIGEDIGQCYTLYEGKRSYSVEYNGLVQEPDSNSIQVVWETNTVDLTDDAGNKRYSIAYYKDSFAVGNKITGDQIQNAGKYYIAVVGVPSLGTYARSDETNSALYTINPKSIAPSTILVSGYDGTYYYTGNAIEPKAISVEDTDLPVTGNANDAQRRTVKLKSGVDYDLTYANNVSAGKASIIVTGKGNYTGTRTAYFNIVSSDTTGNNTWDGTSEGTGSLSDGTSTISASDIKLGFDNSTYECMMYNGYERIPTISITGISTNEFTVTASNNIKPGVATLTITGRGNNYTGTIIKYFAIRADLSTYGQISTIADQVYTGGQITPSITLTCGGNLLTAGKDYNVTYSNNTNVGKASVMATAISDSYYIGTATGSFNISNTATGMEITGYASNYTYTGYAITPDVVVTMNGRALTRGTDYTVTYSNNTNVGTASMVVTGIGSYSGTKTINYTIEAKNIENCVTTAVSNVQYTGGTYTPSVTITDSTTGKTLVAGTDYTLTYSNNTNPGTAAITVTALSKNYTGSKVISFKITSAAVSGLRTSTIKNNSIKLAWTKQDYADGYQICNSNNRIIATTTKNSYTVKGLTSCTTYKLKVRSYVENADGSVSYGDFSTAVSAKTLLNTPVLKARSTTKGKVTLTWSKVAKASGYEIYYSTKKDGVYTRLKTISKSGTRKYVDAGLASGERYYYTIRAYRTVNGVKTYSSYNTIKSVKVK